MRLAPQNVSEDCWYYEEPKGICVVLHGETNQGCLMATIPWKMIRGSLKRKDKKGSRKKTRQSLPWLPPRMGPGYGEGCR